MIQISPSALAQIQKLQKEGQKEKHALRIRVIAGGCSGMSYKMDFEDIIDEKDKVFEEYPPLKVVVDPKSYLFLKGMHLNFSAGLEGRGFEFNNPNASKKCGCGSSFSA